MKFLIKKVLDFLANKKNKDNQDLKELITYLVKSYTKNHLNLEKNDIEKIGQIIRELKGTSLVESLKILQSINETQNLKGDICEFGVAQGKTSKLMAYLIKDTEKKFICMTV